MKPLDILQIVSRCTLREPTLLRRIKSKNPELGEPEVVISDSDCQDELAQPLLRVVCCIDYSALVLVGRPSCITIAVRSSASQQIVGALWRQETNVRQDSLENVEIPYFASFSTMYMLAAHSGISTGTRRDSQHGSAS